MSDIVCKVQDSVSVLQLASTTAEEDILKELGKLRDDGPLSSNILSITNAGLVLRSVAKDNSLSTVVRSSARSLLESWRAEYRKRARSSHEVVKKSAKSARRTEGTITKLYPSADWVLGSKAEIAENLLPRTKVRLMLSDALRAGAVALRDSLQGEQVLRSPEPLSDAIEIALYHKFGSASERLYLRQARSIIHNIKDSGNESFRSNVLLGCLNPEEIAEMTAEEMASSSKRESRRRIRQDMLKLLAMSDPQGDFKCENCGGTLCRRSLGEVR